MVCASHSWMHLRLEALCPGAHHWQIKFLHPQFLTWRCSLGGYGHNARSAKDLCTRTFSAQGLLFFPQFNISHYLVPVTSVKPTPVLSNHCSRDCPIFYRRRKAQKDMAEARLQLDRWDFWACKFSHWLPASAVDMLLRRTGSYRQVHHDACEDETGLLRASRHTCVRVT